MKPDVEIVHQQLGWSVKVSYFTNRYWYYEKSHAFEQSFACEVRARRFAEEVKKLPCYKLTKMVKVGWIKKVF